MPHSAFEGQTPNEMFSGIGNEVTSKLACAGPQPRGLR